MAFCGVGASISICISMAIRSINLPACRLPYNSCQTDHLRSTRSISLSLFVNGEPHPPSLHLTNGGFHCS